MCNLKNLIGGGGCGQDVQPGTRAKLYLMPAEELTGWPQTLLQSTPATPVEGASKILDDPFPVVATPGKGFWRSYDILIDKGMIESNTVGEKGALSFTNDLSFFLQGGKAVHMEFLDNVVNCCLVAMIQLRSDEEHLDVIGRWDDPAKITEIKYTSGAKVGDLLGSTFKLQAADGRTPFKYPVALGIDTTPNP